jgi:hypothetical protein
MNDTTWELYPHGSWSFSTMSDQQAITANRQSISGYPLNNDALYGDMLDSLAALDPTSADEFKTWMERYGLLAKNCSPAQAAIAIRQTKWMLLLLNDALSDGYQTPFIDQYIKKSSSTKWGPPQQTELARLRTQGLLSPEASKRKKELERSAVLAEMFAVTFQQPTIEFSLPGYNICNWSINNDGGITAIYAGDEFISVKTKEYRANYNEVAFKKRATRDFLIAALEHILARVHPSAEWHQAPDGSMIMLPVWKVRCPWEAINLELFRRVCSGVTEPVNICKNCFRLYRAKTIRSEFHNDACRKQFWRKQESKR